MTLAHVDGALATGRHVVDMTEKRSEVTYIAIGRAALTVYPETRSWWYYH